MPRVLAAWGLGGGLGHVTALGGVLERLADWECHAAVLDPAAARDWLPSGVQLHTSPPLIPAPPMPTRTYADVLVGLGWLRDGVLEARLRAWTSLLDAVQPDVVLIDTAPVLWLALRCRADPPQAIGFANPWGTIPDRVPLPDVLDRPTNARSHESELVAALARLGGIELDGLAALTRPYAHFVYGVAETDPWWAHRSAHCQYVGAVVQTGRGASARYPPGPGRRVFAYLKPSYAGLSVVLDALARLDTPALAVVPGHREVTRGRLKITGEPVRFDDLIDATDLVVTHSVLGTGFSFLQAGVSVLLLPMQLEQLAMGLRCAALPGVAALEAEALTGGLDIALAEGLDARRRLAAVGGRQLLNAHRDPFGTVAAAVRESVA